MIWRIVRVACLSLLLPLPCQTVRNNTLGRPAGPEPQPTVLRAGELIETDVPAFAFLGHPICDSSGDVFFEVPPPNQVRIQSGPYLRISRHGDQHTVFLVPTESSDAKPPKSGATRDAVSPDGDFYLLHSDFLDYTLYSFSAAGVVTDQQGLNVPEGITLERFAIENSGVAYVEGFYSGPKTTSDIRKPFAGIFSSSGDLIKDLSDGFQDVHTRALAAHPFEGAVTAGGDGNFYVLQGDRVLVTTQSGQIKRILPLQKPDKDAIAGRIDESQGVLSVEFETVALGAAGRRSVRVTLRKLDAFSGESLGNYALGPGVSNSVLCFSRQDGYTVFGVKDGHLAWRMLPLP